MSSIEADEKGLLVGCPTCGQRNRMRYEGLGQTFRCGKCKTGLLAPTEPIDVTSEAVFDVLTARTKWPVIADFWAPWCGPCKIVAPEFANVAAQGAGQWLVVKVNTEEAEGLVRRFRITSIPTMAVFRGGREVARQMGAMPAGRIVQFLEQAAR